MVAVTFVTDTLLEFDLMTLLAIQHRLNLDKYRKGTPNVLKLFQAFILNSKKIYFLLVFLMMH